MKDLERQAAEIDALADLFKIFADSTRIRIMFVLLDQERNAGEIAELLGMTPSAVSHQLKTLRYAKLVKSRRDGKQIIYSLADEHVERILRTGLEHVEEDLH